MENCRHLREELESFGFALIVVELTTKGKVMTFLRLCYRPLSRQSDVLFFVVHSKWEVTKMLYSIVLFIRRCERVTYLGVLAISNVIAFTYTLPPD